MTGKLQLLVVQLCWIKPQGKLWALKDGLICYTLFEVVVVVEVVVGTAKNYKIQSLRNEPKENQITKESNTNKRLKLRLTYFFWASSGLINNTDDKYKHRKGDQNIKPFRIASRTQTREQHMVLQITWPTRGGYGGARDNKPSLTNSKGPVPSQMNKQTIRYEGE